MSRADNTQDILDSRNIIERIEELQEATERDDDDQAELDALLALAAEGADYAPDWEYGEVLIRDSYFRDYAMELAEDVGAISTDAKWPNNCIDWDKAARELQMDYTAIDFAGVTYWIR